jgi:PadR family transcriptional regulator, regulatory protein PadR
MRKTMTDIQQVRKGSTPLLILSVLSQESLHGYAIMRELEARSQGYFTMNAALLYPTLHQMEQEGLVQARWEEGKSQHRRKVYTITPDGRQRLTQGKSEWEHFYNKLFDMMGHQVETRSEP